MTTGMITMGAKQMEGNIDALKYGHIEIFFDSISATHTLVFGHEDIRLNTSVWALSRYTSKSRTLTGTAGSRQDLREKVHSRDRTC